MISGHHYNQEKTRLVPTLNTSVIQESIWNTPPATILQKAAATFAASASPTSKNLAEKETMEVCGRRKINEAETDIICHVFNVTTLCGTAQTYNQKDSGS